MSHGNPYGKDSFPRARDRAADDAGADARRRAEHRRRPAGAPASRPSSTAMDEVQKRKPWLTHKQPEPWAAILMSDNTRVFYGRSAGQVEERYLANVFGSFRAALEEHLPFTLINDWNLDARLTWRSTRCSCCRTPRASTTGRSRRSRRSSSTAAGWSRASTPSLCDEFGTPRKTSPLADVLGVDPPGQRQSRGRPTPSSTRTSPATLPPDYWRSGRASGTSSEATTRSRSSRRSGSPA